MISYDYSKLRGRIVEKYGTLDGFAKAIGWSMRTTSLKMNCHVAWKQQDIVRACEVLDIDLSEITEYFFKLKV